MIYRLLITLFICANISACASWSTDEDAADLHFRLGTNQLSNGNYPAALKELMRAAELNPKSPLIQNNLGLAYFVRERFDLAEVHIKKAIDLDSKFTDAHNNLARVYIERGKFEEALNESKIVISDLTFPFPEKGLINAGISTFKLGRFSEASSFFLKALKFQKDNCLANSYLGRCYFESKDYRRSTEALDIAVGYCQNLGFDEPHYYSALSHLQNGDKKKAEARLEEVLRLYQDGKYRERARDSLELLRKR
jgi:type IV pilus assembly protein PilF